jgi:hypothetical protein
MVSGGSGEDRVGGWDSKYLQANTGFGNMWVAEGEVYQGVFKNGGWGWSRGGKDY